MRPKQMLRELEKAMPDNAMVASDIGNVCSVSNSYLRFKEGGNQLAAMTVPLAKRVLATFVAIFFLAFHQLWKKKKFLKILSPLHSNMFGLSMVRLFEGYFYF